MGKRKSSKRQPAKKMKKVLDTHFDCVSCFHEQSVSCKIDYDQKVGHLQCRMCGVSYSCAVNYLSHAVDVYHDWIDACEAVNANVKAAKSATQDDRDRGSGRDRDRDRDRDRERDDYGDSSRRRKPYDRYEDEDDDDY